MRHLHQPETVYYMVSSHLKRLLSSSVRTVSYTHLDVYKRQIEERGVYRIHQFEKQEMVVVCKPEDSMMWYDKLWQNTVDFFRSLDIPVRTLECCSGDLADLKVKSLDVEAWSPRQKKYFEVGSCSNLGDAQARRLGIRVKGADGKNYFPHTLNNTVVALSLIHIFPRLSTALFLSRPSLDCSSPAQAGPFLFDKTHSSAGGGAVF